MACEYREREREEKRGEEGKGCQLKSGRDGIECASVRCLERRW